MRQRMLYEAVAVTSDVGGHTRQQSLRQVAVHYMVRISTIIEISD